MPRRTAKRITLANVAAAAQVSQATVCRVLNGHPMVSDELRRRVQAAIGKVGVPSRAAGGSLRLLRPAPSGQGATRIEVLLLRARGVEPFELHADGIAISQARAEPAGFYDDRRHAVHSSFFRAMLQGMHEEAAPWGYTVAQRQCPDLDDGAIRAAVAARDLAGIALMGEGVPGVAPFLAAHRLPAVLVDLPETGALPTIGSDDAIGAGLAVAHLIALGHRRIAFAGDPACPETAATGGRRFRAWRMHMAEAGLPVEARWLRLGEGGMRQAQRWAEEVLAGPRRPSAVLCQNDFIALAVIEGARRRGLAVPAELSVVGYDDCAVAALAQPPLTTIAVPARDMGRAAVQELMLEIVRPDDAPPISRRIVLGQSLVARGSTAPAPAG